MIPDWLTAEVAQYDVLLNDPPETVLDIGANVGAFTLRAAKQWPAAKISAYEPHPENAAAFREHCGNGRITLSEMAVRANSGRDLLLGGDQAVTHSFHNLGRQTGKARAVNCISASDIPSAEFVKIDTEGCELEILSSLNLGNTRALVVEYHRAGDAAAIRAVVEACGLKQFMHIRQGRDLGILKFARPGAARIQQKCYLAVPVYGALDARFARCLTDLLFHPPCEIIHDDLVGDSLVSRARNVLTANFLQSDATHLLFLDSDLIFGADQVARIMNHTEDVVGGFYPKKVQGPIQWCCNAFPDNPPPREDGLQPVKYMGTGFLRISRRVFERMIETYGDLIAYTADETNRIEHDFWSVGVHQFPDGTRRYLSEDWFFCQRWLDMGETVWADTKICVKHVGTAVYPLKTQESEVFHPPTPI